MPYTLGDQTKDIFRWSEAHKLHLEFEVQGTINAGEPVKMHTADNTAIAMADGDAEQLFIGVSLHTNENAYGDYIVAAVRGYTVVMMEADADSTPPGPVEYDGFNATSGRPKVVAATTAPLTIGWALANGDTGDIIPVLVKD